MKQEGMGDGRISWAFEKIGYDINAWYLPWNALWGGHFSVNGEFVKKHGIRWNEKFIRWGGEDNEYGIQLCEAGANITFCPDIEVVHYPTEGSKVVNMGDEEEFKRNYQLTKELILSLHPGNRAVQAWFEIGGGANYPEQREALFKEKGWA